VLEGTSADVVVPQIDAIANTIAKRYHDHRAGIRPQRVARDDRFSRATQARILLDAIEAIVPARVTVPS
jgi:hypothetical protein